VSHARRSRCTAQQIDPGFAMAYWGEAMTFNHAVWMEQDLSAARKALARTPERTAAAAKSGDERKAAEIRARLQAIWHLADRTPSVN
jgi:hypothetical protein